MDIKSTPFSRNGHVTSNKGWALPTDVFQTLDRAGHPQWIRSGRASPSPARGTSSSLDQQLTMIGRDIVKRFPALEMLDNEPIVKVGFDTPTPHPNPSHRLTPILTTNSFARPMAPSFITGVDGSLVSEFLTR
jgi:hypothetical protein